MIDRPTIRSTEATTWIRSMQAGVESGGSEPHLFECSNGVRYLVKAPNNPQGGKVLVNEVVGTLCLQWLGVEHPSAAIVELSPQLLAASPSAKFSNGNPLAAGKGFGSEFVQSDPQGTVTPDRIRNLGTVGGIVVMDTWIQNTDSRQYRLRHLGGPGPDYQFIPLDQGHSISHTWTDIDLPRLATNVQVAPALTPFAVGDCTPYILRLREFDTATAKFLTSQIPLEWLNDAERGALELYLVERARIASGLLSQTYGLM